MSRTTSRLLAAVLLLCPLLVRAEEPVDLQMVSRIRDEGFHHSQVMETVRHLTDEIGDRVTGSPHMKQANEWTRDRLAAWGLQNAHLEPYAFGRGWSFGRGLVQVVKPYEKTLLAMPKGWTPGTDGPIRGPLMSVKIESEKDFDTYRGKLAGKILLLGAARDLIAEAEAAPLPARRYTPEALEELVRFTGASAQDPVARAKSYLETLRVRLAIQQFLADEKALATIDGSSYDWGILRASRAGSQKADGPVTLPSVTVAAEEFNRLFRLLDAGREIEVEVDVRAAFHAEDLNAYNTIAEIPGTDRKGEVVMAGAHLDSYQGGTGATDNAAGSAIMMEAVRILQALGVKPRRTIRIALWSGEEQGLLGSRAWVEAHLGERAKSDDPAQADLPSFLRTGPFQPKPEHARLAAYFNTDNGGGRIRGIYTQENAAVAPVFEAWLRPLSDLGATTITQNDTGATDHLPFDAAGIPAFQFIQDEMDYEGRTWHSNVDTYDHLEKEDLQQAAVVVATFLYHAAMRPDPLPRKHLR